MAAKKNVAKAIPASKAGAPKPKPTLADARPKPVAAEALRVVKKPLKVPSAAAQKSPLPISALEAGSQAPAFSLPDENGSELSSTVLAGKPYVIYFYPKDDTPGCTQEACDFRDNLRTFNAQQVRVLGVSPDDPKRHAKFKEKYGLTFTLLSDVDKSLINAYGVWVKKLNYGREYMGVQRSTFLVDKAGKIVKAWNGVRVPGHVEAVLAALSA